MHLKIKISKNHLVWFFYFKNILRAAWFQVLETQKGQLWRRWLVGYKVWFFEKNLDKYTPVLLSRFLENTFKRHVKSLIFNFFKLTERQEFCFEVAIWSTPTSFEGRMQNKILKRIFMVAIEVKKLKSNYWLTPQKLQKQMANNFIFKLQKVAQLQVLKVKCKTKSQRGLSWFPLKLKS